MYSMLRSSWQPFILMVRHNGVHFVALELVHLCQAWASYQIRVRMHGECRERFPCHRLRRKPLRSGMHHGTYVLHVPWCMSGLLTRVVGDSSPGIPGACATRSFTYLARNPLKWCHKSVMASEITDNDILFSSLYRLTVCNYSQMPSF